MRIKLLTDIVFEDGRRFGAGERADLSGFDAARLVAAGHAERCPFDPQLLATAAAPSQPPRIQTPKRDKRS